MVYAQIKSGSKLHIAMEPGEFDQHGKVVLAGNLSYPICGTPMRERSNYRMTCNLSLAHACQRCKAVIARRRCAA